MTITCMPTWTATYKDEGVSFSFLAAEGVEDAVAESIYRHIYGRLPDTTDFAVTEGLAPFDEGSQIWIATRDWTILEDNT